MNLAAYGVFQASFLRELRKVLGQEILGKGRVFDPSMKIFKTGSNSRYPPHQGHREKARRLRQREKWMLSF